MMKIWKYLTMAVPANIGVAHGQWGEDVACRYLRKIGYGIVERNVRPCRWDRRLEIDIIAFNKATKSLVFVEVKQHKNKVDRQRRLRSITHHKLLLLRRACKTYLARNHWSGSYRFDVIEIYGEPESKTEPIVDHIRSVRLFVSKERFCRLNHDHSTAV